jgi:hydroxypyruvate reductase
VGDIARQLVTAWNRHGGELRISRGSFVTTVPGPRRGPRIAWGEPTIALPADRGEGGRAQQLALVLAGELRGDWPVSAFIAGSDGIDGPAPAHRPAPAGAFVDETTWDRIAEAGIDPEHALARCDAGPALDAIGALVVTGPTGINHGDVMLLG